MIVIPGEMPNNCFECPCAHIGKKPHKQWCNITKNNISNYRCTRPIFACPINIEASNRASKHRYAQGITSIQVLDEKNMLRNNSKENDLEIARRCNSKDTLYVRGVMFEKLYEDAQLPELDQHTGLYRLYAYSIKEQYKPANVYSISFGLKVTIPEGSCCRLSAVPGICFPDGVTIELPGVHVLIDQRVIITENDEMIQPGQYVADFQIC